MTPTTTVHFFPLRDHGPAVRFCGDWREGHSWTVLAGAVTCSRCRLLAGTPDANGAETARKERQRE
jgi:hypothetical protein